MLDADGRPRPGPRTRVRILRAREDSAAPREDWVATEEPLEIRLGAASQEQSVAVTMRTPGHDWELATGFLYSEGLLRGPAELAAIRYCADDQRYNVVTVDLRRPALPSLAGADRYGAVSSACGVCGRTSLDLLEQQGLQQVPAGPTLRADVLAALPQRLRAAQEVFAATGGLHGAAFFDPHGALMACREDVGRHNALDKLVGWALLGGALPLSDGVVLVSGRASFELAQKCVAAGVTCLAAISAPSSLAVATAERFGLTLVGMLRDGGFNVYAGAARIVTEEQPDAQPSPRDTGAAAQA